MLDFVFLVMFGILPILAFSIYLVRQRRAYRTHKRLQLTLATSLFLAVLAFEIDLRFITDWEVLAEPSPFFQAGTWNLVWYSLIVHLIFAVPTLGLWIYVVVHAWRSFPVPPRPNSHSKTHRLWGRTAAAGMFLTGLTGWVFYYLAFVA